MPTGPFWSRCSPRNTDPNEARHPRRQLDQRLPVRPTMSPIGANTAPTFCRA